VLSPPAVKVLLLDIEGTTTPLAFVTDTLFPYARKHVRRFLEERAGRPEVRAALDLLRAEHAQEREAPPPWDETPDAVAGYVYWLMDRDRKSTGLKALQGWIWQEGFAAGELRGQLYDDVPPALARWKEQGRRIAIFSSGSVLAQELLFRTTAAGDLTRFLEGYFDTHTGPKNSPESYAAIVRVLGAAPAHVLFLSDVVAELDAARQAGLATGLAVRGAPPPSSGEHPLVHNFAEVFPASGS
jgi:enolase-phosphatase E1